VNYKSSDSSDWSHKLTIIYSYTIPHLLVLGVMGIGEQLSGLLRGAPGGEQAQGDPRRLPRHCTVLVEDSLDVLKDVVVICAQRCQTQTQAGSVLDGLQERE
jgi:hypothetical protein